MVDGHPASLSTAVAEHSRPTDGDIVVREQRRGQSLAYLLRAQPGPDQIIVWSRDTALAQAQSIANRRRVRAWLTVDGQAHVPLEEVFTSRRDVPRNPHGNTRTDARSLRPSVI